MTKETKTVYQMIAQVSAELAVEGITKAKKNTQQGYSFRGIDDVYNALAPIMSKVGLVILPRVISRNVVERTTKSGNALFYTTVNMEFDFVSSHDGSKHTVGMYGEAMDSADKSTNKAMSAAYKYACMQAFCIPTEGDNDADSTTHEVAPKVEPKAKKEPSPEDIEKAAKLTTIKEALLNAKDVKTIDLIWNNHVEFLNGIKENSPNTYKKIDQIYLETRGKLDENEIPTTFPKQSVIMAG